VRYFRVDRSHIAYLRFILEGYDGLATLSTVDAREGIVSFSIPESLVDDMDLLLQALGHELPMTEIRMSAAEENQQDA
jgi:hypothetical protein